MVKEENGSGNSICTTGKKFLETLKEMDEKKEKKRVISGSIEGPFFSRATFSCTVRVGFEDELL